MLSILLTPDTPEWLLSATLIASTGIIIGMLIWGTILEIRYVSPYTIIKSSGKEKWRKAIILALLQTGMFPILGLIQPILSPASAQWPTFPLICGGLWIIVLPVVVLYKHWEFERHIKRYKKIDQMIKSDVYTRIFASSPINWMKMFMTTEQKRFWDEGYSEDLKGTDAGAG